MGTQEPVEGETSGTSTTSTGNSLNDEDGQSNAENEKDLKVIEWEDFHDAFVNLGGVAVNLSKARAKKQALTQKLEAAIEIGTRSSERVDTLEALKRRLREKQGNLETAISSLRSYSHQLVQTRENFIPSAKALILSTEALAAARGRVKEADRLLSGEGGQGRLRQLRKLLDVRRRELVEQVASLYPLGSVTVGTASNQQSKPQASGCDTAAGPWDGSPTVIAGLQIHPTMKKQPGFLKEKSEHETTATALGYVAHVVSLVSTYLDVTLRYPVRLGASRSYIQDHCPATDSANADAGPPTSQPAKQTVEFPLFSEGQDQTRSAYAIFLLNKDLEQILNKLGAESCGPRHTLLNLNRVLTIVNSKAVP